MKKIIATIIVLATSTSFADGFVCESLESDLRVKIYNKVLPSDGTRSASVMIVSDPQVQPGRQTIAKFSTENGSLITAHSGQLKFIGDVDLRFNDMGRSGEYLVGTRLGEVELIKLNIDFTYGDALSDGDTTSGRIIVVKRNGAAAVRDAVCTRYLKSE